MSQYWAQFTPIGEHVYRFDTRVYLNDVETCGANDPAIGAIVAKNPGSANPSHRGSNKLQAISLDGDKLLPVVHSVVTGAYRKAERDWPERGYVRVFNLFYMCDKDAKKAKGMVARLTPSNCATESQEVPWLWYAWGGLGNELPHLSKRFAFVAATKRFYYDKNHRQIVDGHPGLDSFPRHTQGLEHAPLIAHLASLLK